MTTKKKATAKTTQAKATEPAVTDETYSDASGTDDTAQDGAKARLETMDDRNAKAAGQVATTSAPKKG